LAEGTTTIVNAACDPEVVDVANFLNQAGARILGAGTSTITVEGVSDLNAIEYDVAGDRLVAGTFLCAAAITGGDIEVNGLVPTQLTMVSRKLYEMGCQVKETANGIYLKGPERLKPINVVTFPFPGFPTDLLPCILALSTTADGTSHIKETIFDNRFAHTLELQRLGANITITGNDATINGVKELAGASIMASDIRGGVGLVLAALRAVGQSELLRVYHIDRGYDRIEEKLSALGADIRRVKQQ
jgi:UDP-N-acetylglucosamine 1-carboxyvinyltransferase